MASLSHVIHYALNLTDHQRLDACNTVFEFGGAVFSIWNVKKVLKDKSVKGVSLWPALWFITWGGYNLYYYPALQQPMSGVAALCLFIINTTWFALAIHYKAFGEWNEKFDRLVRILTPLKTIDTKPLSIEEFLDAGG